MIDLLASTLLLFQSAQSVEVDGFDPLSAGKPDDRGDAEFDEVVAHRLEGQVERPGALAAGERTVEIQHIVPNLFKGRSILVVLSQEFVKP